MIYSSGAWAFRFQLTLILCAAYLGGWAGFTIPVTREASLVWPMVFAAAGAIFGGLLGVCLSFLAVVVMDREYKRRVVTLTLWGTTAVFLSVAVSLGFRSLETVSTYSALAILYGLIFGAVIGAVALGACTEVKDCPG